MASTISFPDFTLPMLSPLSFDESILHANESETSKTDTMKEITVPTHPIPSMQGAFTESLLESSGSPPEKPEEVVETAKQRRAKLLEQDVDEETHIATRWKRKPSQQYHELWKLMAQISFGIYLLLNGLAKDDEAVMTILQGHVDEVDEFLETMMEDFDLGQEDINERLRLLKLPLENIVIFDRMLEDREFRLQIVSGNEKIEHVIKRTAALMNDSLRDVKEGMDACREFALYLAERQQDNIWKERRPEEIFEVFKAMKENVEGWYKAYITLQTKGNNLGVSLVQLGSIVAEMDRRAGEISRKTRFSQDLISAPPTSHQHRQSRQLRLSMSKNLPSDQNLITPAIKATLPAFQLVDERERTPEPDSDASEVEMEPEPVFLLKPHTYSPMPSPNPQKGTFDPLRSNAFQELPAEIPRRSSLRKRFSSKEQDDPVAREPTPPLRPRVYSSAASTIRGRESSITTPPSRGLDSAYCSDFEKASPPPLTHPTLPPHPGHRSHDSRATLRPPPNMSPILTPDFIPSPRSEQHQFFRPVQASPHSPLQRPWTATGGIPPTPIHNYSSSSTSNLSAQFNQARDSNHYNPRHPPSHLRPNPTLRPRNAPSAMGMSMMSDMTTAEEIGADGVKRKVKKKRSAFGWLKKAFSLSEEEKMAFEERKRGAVEMERREMRPPKWIDGKRVR